MCAHNLKTSPTFSLSVRVEVSSHYYECSLYQLPQEDRNLGGFKDQ